MKIQKLRLCNFSSYEGENQLDLTTNDTQTVVLIGGQNGAGKTSLFTAIKIALYGPLAFGYAGMNSYYVKRIKDQINTKAFQNDVLHAYVSIEIAVKREREIKYYTVTRRWYTDEKRMAEAYTIMEGDRLLTENEKTYFENYLYSTLPPNLFDFFLFDGEEVGSIFAADGYHHYVRDALLTLCGMDVYASIQRFCGSFVDQKTSDETAQLRIDYQDYQRKAETLRKGIAYDTERIQACTEEMEALQSEIEAIESKFEAAGGIPDKKLRSMRAQEASKDKERAEITARMKTFMEDTLPFFLLKDMVAPLQAQMQNEEQLETYRYIQNLVTPGFLQAQLQEQCPSPQQTAEQLYQAILHRIRPDFEEEGAVPILDLSREEINRIEQVIETVKAVDSELMISQIRKEQQLAKDLVKIRQKLRETLTEEDARRYRLQKETAEAKRDALQTEVSSLSAQVAAAREQLAEQEQRIGQVYQQIMTSAQNQHIYELSSGITHVMARLIEGKTASIRQQLAVRTLEGLREIYRKDDLISLIEIEESFRLHLYQAQYFSLQELRSLLANVGNKEFLIQIGQESAARLRQYYHAGTDQEMLVALKGTDASEEKLQLYRRIELSRLSKGERQIFILALYWAMVKISGKEIPFIIDTPYARIDADHREEISRKFFPQISSQVIILSTDEEITEEYYRILKPYIAKEYLLSNQQGGAKTMIEPRYFF